MPHCRPDWYTTVSRPGDRGTNPPGTVLRKVGAPQDRMLARGQSGRPAGKCHREQTADGLPPRGRAQVRVKRCGKSAPAAGATRLARQTPSGARPNRERVVRPSILPGWPHRWMVTHPESRKGPVDRTPPTGRLTVTHTDWRWGLCFCFRLQGSWRVSGEQLSTQVTLFQADTWRTRRRHTSAGCRSVGEDWGRAVCCP